MRILLAYDGLEHSRHALEETAKLAAEGKGEITVLSVVPPDARGSKSGGHVMLRPHSHEDVARAHAYLRELGHPVRDEDGSWRPGRADRRRSDDGRL